MSGRGLRFGVAGALALLTMGCGDKAQTLDASTRKVDRQPWTLSDAAEPAFAAPGWKSGDKIAWEEQIRKRHQAQNDYVR